MNEKDLEKVELRLKIPKWISDTLKEYCYIFGTNAVSTITPLLVEYLGHPSRMHEVVVNYKLTPNISRVATKRGSTSPKSKKEKTNHQLPKDFDPPREISEAHNLDHEKAVIAFTDWAKGGNHKKADWNATYRNACRKWLPQYAGTQNTSIIEKVI